MSSITPSGKVTFPVTNLQASDWVHCEEETGAYSQLSQYTYKKFFFNLFILKKNALFKKISKMYSFFFSKRDNWAYVYCTKCNDNFKFTISLKSYEE